MANASRISPLQAQPSIPRLNSIGSLASETDLPHILGLHLGHDASASVVGDSGVLVSVVQERFTRVRHDFGLDIETIDIALQSAGVSLDASIMLRSPARN